MATPIPVGRVVVLRRDAEGRETEGGALPFEADELVFGRDPAADVRIRLSTVSRVALRLVRDGARVLLHNTSSQANQVQLNGAEVEREVPLVLRHGDVFSIGGRPFRFDYGAFATPRLAPSPRLPPL